MPAVDRDQVGGIRALTTLAPVERTTALRLRLAFVREFPGMGRPLEELSFIHFARWALLSDVPAPDGSGEPWPLNWSQLLFDASFDGARTSYLEAFADLLPRRLTRLFGACVGFTTATSDPDDPLRPILPGAFRDFVNGSALEVLDFQAAGRPRSVTAVRQAIAIERAERRADSLAGAELHRRRRRIEAMALGAPPDRPGRRESIAGQLAGRVRRRPRVSSMIVLAPVLPGRLRALRPNRRQKQTPLGRMPFGHFARLALVPPKLWDVGQPLPDVLPVSYLLFISDHDGRREDHLEAIRVRSPDAADELFGLCAAYPGADRKRAFHDWFDRHQVPTAYYVAGYPSRTIDEVDELLEARERVAATVDRGPRRARDAGAGRRP